MQDIQGTALEEKYRHELHCNEVMLLPYYIASLNIEQEFFQRTGAYLPFEGIALADTFELLEQQQGELFTRENTERVERQKAADMFVVVGNPPYNMGQVNDSDNNRNRKYEKMDARIADTYAADSKATNKNALYDPYIKAIRWASEPDWRGRRCRFCDEQRFFWTEQRLMACGNISPKILPKFITSI